MSVPLLHHKKVVVDFHRGRKVCTCTLISKGVYLCVSLRERHGHREDVWVFEEWKETFARSLLPLNIFVHFIANKNSKSISFSSLQRALWSLVSKWPPTFPINRNHPHPLPKKTSAICISLYQNFMFFFFSWRKILEIFIKRILIRHSSGQLMSWQEWGPRRAVLFKGLAH